VAALNYHHLRYFRAIARAGSLTGAARRLNVAPSALSIQLRTLEEALGHALFERAGRTLTLTEAGRIALDHAETIFRTGEELVARLKGQAAAQQVLRVGAVATLSRNFQLAVLRPLIGRAEVELVVRSGSLAELLAQLAAHTLDLVLANAPVPRDAETAWQSLLVDQQPASLVGRARERRRRLRFPGDLDGLPMLLPSRASSLRAAFDLLIEQAGVRPHILAEVDDMAMLRLLARESPGVTLVPPVVVRDELANGALRELCAVPGLTESFYAVTLSRRFPNPLLRDLLGAAPATAPRR
jgi:LysR family transcriptional activator of nhaA